MTKQEINNFLKMHMVILIKTKITKNPIFPYRSFYAQQEIINHLTNVIFESKRVKMVKQDYHHCKHCGVKINHKDICDLCQCKGPEAYK